MVDVIGMHKHVLDMRCSRALLETHFKVKGCHFYVALNTSWGDSASPEDAGLIGTGVIQWLNCWIRGGKAQF